MSLATAAPPALPEPGTVIAGKYEVERVLGHGGMGVVVAAKHTALKQRVAIKFLLPAAMELPESAARFLREAQAAAAIQSEHVARVIDVGSLENGEPYMVMEYLAGEDLGALFKSRRHFAIEEAVDMVLEACEALAEAHALGIVHRDIKPGNLFVTRRADGSSLIKVLDFGLSKALTSERAEGENSLTASTTVIGSPLYMSPEQLRSLKNVDARTDIWSLGVILYMLLAGRRPYDGETMTAICAAIISEVPLPITEIRPEVPLGLDVLVRRCLEKDLPRRVQSVAELARGLAPFGSPAAKRSMERIVKVLPAAPAPDVTEATTTPQPGDSGAASGEPSTGAESSWGQTGSIPRRKMTVAIGAAVVLFVVGAAVAFGLSSPRAAVPASQIPPPGTTSLPVLDPAPPSPVAAAPPTPRVEPVAPASASAAPPSTAAPRPPSAQPRSPAPAAAPRPATSATPAAKPPVDPMERWN